MAGGLSERAWDGHEGRNVAARIARRWGAACRAPTIVRETSATHYRERRAGPYTPVLRKPSFRQRNEEVPKHRRIGKQVCIAHIRQERVKIVKLVRIPVSTTTSD